MSDRTNDPGWVGFDEQGRQQCLRCWKWQFPVVHSCPAAPNLDYSVIEGVLVATERTPPARHLTVAGSSGEAP